MFIGFKAEKNFYIDAFIEHFMNPPGTVSQITHSWLYGSKHLHEFSPESLKSNVKSDMHIFIIECHGILELIGYYVLLTFAGSLLISFIFNNFFFFYFMLPFAFLAMFLVSGFYHTLNFIQLLKRSGYKGSVKPLNVMTSRMLMNYARRSMSNDEKPL